MEKVVLLDMDYTLLVAPLDTNKYASSVMFKNVFDIDAHEEMVDNMGKTETRIITDVLSLFGKKIDTIPDAAYKVWSDAMLPILKKTPAMPLPGVIDFLEALKKEHIAFGLLTGGNYYRAEKKLESAKLDSYFRDTSGKLIGAFGSMAYNREDLIPLAKASIGKPDATGVLIDDSLFVAKMIQRLSLPHIMVATGGPSAETLKTYVTNVIPGFDNGGWQEAIKIIKKY